jgi:hypothetical protein
MSFLPGGAVAVDILILFGNLGICVGSWVTNDLSHLIDGFLT